MEIKALLEEVMGELGYRLEARGLSVRLTVTRVTLEQLNHDLLFQLIYNLINNAIRYNKDAVLPIRNLTQNLLRVESTLMEAEKRIDCGGGLFWKWL